MHRAQALEQLARGGADAVDVLARLLPRLGAQLVGGRLGGLEDLPHAAGCFRRDRAAAAPALQVVGDAAQVLVDGVGVVAAAHRREVRALDRGPVHGL